MGHFLHCRHCGMPTREPSPCCLAGRVLGVALFLGYILFRPVGSTQLQGDSSLAQAAAGASSCLESAKWGGLC